MEMRDVKYFTNINVPSSPTDKNSIGKLRNNLFKIRIN